MRSAVVNCPCIASCQYVPENLGNRAQTVVFLLHVRAYNAHVRLPTALGREENPFGFCHSAAAFRPAPSRFPNDKTQATRAPNPSEIPRCSASDLCAKGAPAGTSVVVGVGNAPLKAHRYAGASSAGLGSFLGLFFSRSFCTEYVFVVLGVPATLAVLVYSLHIWAMNCRERAILELGCIVHDPGHRTLVLVSLLTGPESQ